MDANQPRRRGFPTTRWSEVDAAAHESPSGDRPALTKLLNDYLPILRLHLVAKHGQKPDEADDLLQGFIADNFLQTAFLERADRKKGRFRSFLLATLKYYYVDGRRALNTVARGGGLIRQELTEDLFDMRTSGDADLFNVEWARTVMQSTIDTMRNECESTGRSDLWSLFENRVLRPAQDGTEPCDYATMCEQFGFESPKQASNAMVTLRRMFERNLRIVIGRYERRSDEIDREIEDFKRIFAAAAQSQNEGDEV